MSSAAADSSIRTEDDGDRRRTIVTSARTQAAARELGRERLGCGAAGARPAGAGARAHFSSKGCACWSRSRSRRPRRGADERRRRQRPRARQALSQVAGERRRRRSPSRSQAGRGLRPARAQRGREDDHGRHADHACRPTAGTAEVGGVDVSRDPVAARSRLAVVPQRSNLDRALSIRETCSFTPPTTVFRRASAAPGRRAARAVRPARARRQQAGLHLRRPGAADHDRAGADARAGGAVPRRAVDRPRPCRPPVRLGPPARAEGARRDARPDDARHERGRRARRPGRDHGPRQAPRDRHAGGARARRCPASTTLDLHTSAPDGRPLDDAARRVATRCPASRASTATATARRAAPEALRLGRRRRSSSGRRRRSSPSAASISPTSPSGARASRTSSSA